MNTSKRKPNHRRRSQADTCAALRDLALEHGVPNYFTHAEVSWEGGASVSSQRRTGTLWLSGVSDTGNVRAAYGSGGWYIDEPIDQADAPAERVDVGVP